MSENNSTKSVKISMGHFFPCVTGATLSERWQKNKLADYVTLWWYKTLQKSSLFLHTNCYIQIT